MANSAKSSTERENEPAAPVGASPPAGGGPPGEEPTGGGSGLVRVTVNLTPRSHQDLQKLAAETGLGKTDVINRALQVYSLVEDLMTKGGGALTVLNEDGTRERIYIL